MKWSEDPSQPWEITFELQEPAQGMEKAIEELRSVNGVAQVLPHESRSRAGGKGRSQTAASTRTLTVWFHPDRGVQVATLRQRLVDLGLVILSDPEKECPNPPRAWSYGLLPGERSLMRGYAVTIPYSSAEWMKDEQARRILQET